MIAALLLFLPFRIINSIHLDSEAMKFTTVFIILSSILIFQIKCDTKEFNFGGWKGIVESFGRIDGKESNNNDEMSSKAELAIKRVIEKHLANKKKNKVQRNGTKKDIPANENSLPVIQSDLPDSINWDEHKEARDMINQRISGGTQAVNDLLNLLREQKQAPAN